MSDPVDDSDRPDSGVLSVNHTRATYESLVNSLPLSLVIKDRGGRRLFANHTYLQTRGLELHDVLGKTDAELFPAEIAAAFAADDRTVLGSGRTLHDVEEYIDKHGSAKWIERLKSPIFDEQKQIIGIQIVFWDATDRYLAERELNFERHLLNTLLKNIPDSIYFKDLDSRFVRISEAMAHKFGIENASDLIGKTDADIFTTEHAEAARRDEMRVIESGIPVVDLVERETWPDRKDTWCMSTKMPLRDDKNIVVGTFGISRDITALKRYEDELCEARDAADAANKAKSDFLANMSHEIRTPMNAIIGMSELLAKTELNGQQLDYVNLVRDSAESLLRLLNEILDFSKIESRMLQLELIPFSLRDLIERSAQTLAIRASEKRLELACRVSPDLPDRWMGDPGRLRQVLLNLIGNAIKFTDEGEIVVDVSPGEPSAHAPRGTTPLRFGIRDTGIGIPKDKHASVLDPFTQADASTTRRFGGTGLGLAISKQLVELMHGTLELDSRPGHGTEFYFTGHFQLADQQVVDAEGELASLTDTPVLLVDDNETNLRILKEVFSAWQLEPTTATDGRQALLEIDRAEARGKPFRLAVLDCMMPNMDGFELASRIRENCSSEQLKLIILSSAAAGDDLARCRESSISRYMTKPVVQSELLDTVLHVMQVKTAPASEPAELPDCPPMRVLVAEDGIANQQVALGMLRAAGHRAVVVSDGKQAVASWHTEPLDLILMDMHMPIMDGIEATEAIRYHEAETGKHIPIIALTAAALKSDSDACMKAGMDGYLTKPIHHRQLQEMLARFAPARSVLEDLKDEETDLLETEAALFSDEVESSSTDFSNADFLGESTDVVDLGAAASRVPGGLRGVRRLAEVFVVECGDLMNELRRSIPAGEASTVQRAAHTLKGSANLFSAKRVRDVAGRIEQTASNGDMAATEALMNELEDETKSMLDELNHFLTITADE